MKLLLISIVFVCCILIGLLIKQNYYIRQNFYKDTLSFCNYLKLNISCSKQKLLELSSLSNISCGREFQSLLDLYVEYLCGNISKQQFEEFKIKALTEVERQEVISFLCGLGQYLKEEEIENINLMISTFESKYNMCQHNNNKYSTLMLKLFAILGLVLFIIFI